MKKILSTILAVLLSVLLISCGLSSDGTTRAVSTTEPSTKETQETEPSDEQADEKQEEASKKESPAEPSKEEESSETEPEESTAESTAENTTESTEAPEPEEVTVEEQVLLDESGVVVTLKSYNEKALFGPEFKILIENNTEKSLTFTTLDESVNGYMISGLMSESVAAGKKANGELTFMSYSLEKAGIETIADIEFKLYVYDSDSWDDYLESGLISVKTSAAETYEYVYDESGEVIYEGNDIKLVAKGLMDSSDWGPQILIYAVNNGTQPVTVSAEDVSVNDFMVSAYFVATMLPGKHVIDTMTFLDSSLEDNDIEKIESAEMSFCIYNEDTWDTIANTDPVTLYFSE